MMEQAPQSLTDRAKVALATLWTLAVRDPRPDDLDPLDTVPLPEAHELDLKFVRKGQHVTFEVPAFRGSEVVRAFCNSHGLKLLDLRQRGPVYVVKVVDTP